MLQDDGEDSGKEGCPTAAHEGSWCSLWKSRARAGRESMRRLQLMESCCWTRLLAGAVANAEEDPLEQLFWQEL